VTPARRDELLRKVRWSLAEVRALTGWGERKLRRWLRTHGRRGKWVYEKQVRRGEIAQFFTQASEEKPDTCGALSEGKQGVAHVVTERAEIKPPKLRPHDDAYFHRQHFLAGMSLRLLAELHDLSRRAVDAGIQRHGKRQHDAQVAHAVRRESDRARLATGT
jgi:hypothetical protein